MSRIAASCLIATAAVVGVRGQAVGGSKGILEFGELVNTTTPDLKVSHTETLTKNGVTSPVVLSKIGASGDVIDGVIFGALMDNFGNVLNESGTNEPLVSNDPDFTSMLFDAETGTTLFSLVHFERPNPGISYLVHLDHNSDECTLTPTKYEPVQIPDVGIWVPCSGSVTPMGTHFGSEEGDPDARAFEAAIDAGDVDAISSTVAQMMSFFGFNTHTSIEIDGPDATIEDYSSTFFPYKYAHAWEFAVLNPAGDYEIEKRYALGRLSFEMCIVAPNKLTAYCTDDGVNNVFVKLEMDVEGDLNSGTLSCAKMDQISGQNGGEFDISWLALGSVTDAKAELEGLAETTRFSDIFLTAEFDTTTGQCEDETFTAVQTGSATVECLKLNEATADVEKVAAFFETRRYCAMIGGTTEFVKMEGINYEEESQVYFTSMSTVGAGMLEGDSQYDIATGDHMRLDEANSCGCVYKLTTDEGGYNVNGMVAEVCGEPIETDSEGNRCNLDGIASPDNVVSIAGYNELLIAEDTSRHIYNYLWSYNLGSKELTRIASVPLGAEVTGPTGFHYPDIDTCDYFLLVNQHPDTGAAAVHFLASNSASAVGDDDDDDDNVGDDDDDDNVGDDDDDDNVVGDDDDEDTGDEEENEEGLTTGAKVGIMIVGFVAGVAFFFFAFPRIFLAKETN